MKTILCYGDSNTWGTAPMLSLDDVRRFGLDERWPGVLRHQLGNGYWVVEEGLPGRTTVWDDPIEGIYKNGKTYLLPCLESHHPIDLVILMLGSNDLKKRFSVTAFDIAAGAGVLVDIIQGFRLGRDPITPKVLLMCPPPLGKLGFLKDMFEDGDAKSRKLAPHYQEIAKTRGCFFLNTGDVIVCSDVDGIHFEPGEHRKLGLAVAEKVKTILG
jgi:lysophospholipase L1-like esterase